MPTMRLTVSERAIISKRRKASLRRAAAVVRTMRAESRLGRFARADRVTVNAARSVDLHPVCAACEAFPCVCWHAAREAAINAHNAALS
jgi:hypothetical protein